MSVVTESQAESPAQSSVVVRILAHAISYIFHPMFVPLYVALFVLFVHPLLFAGFTYDMKIRLAATVFVNLTLLPAATVFLCWRLKFVNSLHMDDQKERIIPLAAAMIFYFWCWYVLKNNVAVPEQFRTFLLGCFLTIIGGWLANIVFKVSLHALAMGGVAAFFFILTFGADGSSAQYLAAVLIICGAVCSARLLVGAHVPADVYAGFLVGALCQAIATMV